MKILFGFLLCCFSQVSASAQSTDSVFFERPMVLQTTSGDISGTLALPNASGKFPVALIIAGSGPTDRNGNSMFTKNDAYKKLAQGLAEAGVATLRYDKRGIGSSAKAMKKEADLRFEDYINDAVDWVQLLKKDTRFSTVTIIGHSEGSLIGMVAAKLAGADGYISIAGAGRPADEILKEQFEKAPGDLQALAVPMIDSLKQGLTVTSVDKRLFVAFRPSVQPYMISWLKYDPQQEIAKLKIPVMLVHGTNDIQVPVEDVRRLASAKKDAKLMIVQDMNHVLKTVTGDFQANVATYKDPSLPLAEGLVEAVASFEKKEVK